MPKISRGDKLVTLTAFIPRRLYTRIQILCKRQNEEFGDFTDQLVTKALDVYLANYKKGK